MLTSPHPAYPPSSRTAPVYAASSSCCSAASLRAPPSAHICKKASDTPPAHGGSAWTYMECTLHRISCHTHGARVGTGRMGQQGQEWMTSVAAAGSCCGGFCFCFCCAADRSLTTRSLEALEACDATCGAHKAERENQSLTSGCVHVYEDSCHTSAANVAAGPSSLTECHHCQHTGTYHNLLGTALDCRLLQQLPTNCPQIAPYLC